MEASSPEILAYYEAAGEVDRLFTGRGQLEYERTKDLIGRVLPDAPSVIADVGGGAGAYAFWLASRGHDVHLRDLAPANIAAATSRPDGLTLASAAVGDGRDVDLADDTVDLVLLLGPMYHLQARHDRLRCMAEAYRILRRGGHVAVAAITRYAPLLDGVVGGFYRGPDWSAVVDEIEATEGNLNPRGTGFTQAYLHTPDQLAAEVAEAGFVATQVFGVEGIGWAVSDFDARWENDADRRSILDAARRVESDRSILGVNMHLLAVARKG